MLCLKAPHLVLATGLLFSGFALAQDATVTPQPTAEAPANTGHMREMRQQRRIHQGADQGQLTTRETKRLKLEQRAIDRQQKRARADGVVTAQEQKRIHRMQAAAGKDITRQRQDAASGPAR